MTNNLSKQLCKLCGIKLKIDCAAPSWKRYECPETLEEPLGIYNCNRCEFRDFRYKYPDFTKPENFVKLLELNIAGDTLWELIEQFSLEFLTDRKMFLEILLRTLNNIDPKTKFVDCQETIIKSIKQVIKNTQWNYG